MSRLRSLQSYMENNIKNNLIETDLQYILENTENIWEELNGARIFITGGTGFFGKWLLESLAYANRLLQLDLSVVVLTRDASRFKEQNGIVFYQGDVRDFSFPKGNFSHIIHAATDASAKLNAENPVLMLDTILYFHSICLT